MTSFIEKLKDPYFIEVKKSHLTCPICGADLYTVYNRMLMIYDDNIIYQCGQTEEHRFWKNGRELGDVLHLNKNASETDFKSEQDYLFEDGKWNKIEKI